jgi:hypothetical protein
LFTTDIGVLNVSHSNFDDADFLYVLGLFEDNLLPNCTVVCLRHTRLLRVCVDDICRLLEHVSFLDISCTPLASAMYRPDLRVRLADVYARGRLIFIRSPTHVAEMLWTYRISDSIYEAVIAAHEEYYSRTTTPQ